MLNRILKNSIWTLLTVSILGCKPTQNVNCGDGQFIAEGWRKEAGGNCTFIDNKCIGDWPGDVIITYESSATGEWVRSNLVPRGLYLKSDYDANRHVLQKCQFDYTGGQTTPGGGSGVDSDGNPHTPEPSEFIKEPPSCGTQGRLQGQTCVCLDQSGSYAMLNFPENVTTNISPGQADNTYGQRFWVSFKITNYAFSTGYYLVIAHNPSSTVFNNSASLATSDYSVPFSMAQSSTNMIVWEKNGDDVSGVMEVKTDLKSIASFTAGSTANLTVLIQQQPPGSSTRTSIGQQCTFQITNTTNTKELKLLVLNNTKAGTPANMFPFKSAITDYSYGSRNFSTIMTSQWYNRVNCNITTTNHTVQSGLVLDAQGNITHLLTDLPAGANSFLDIWDNPDPMEKDEKYKNFVLLKWQARLKNYLVEYYNGNTNLAGLSASELSDPTKTFTVYRNQIPIIVTSASIVVDPDGTENSGETARLNDYTYHFYNSDKTYALNSHGITRAFAAPNNYMGICYIYYWSCVNLIPSDYKDARVIATGMHEIAHAWYYKGSSGIDAGCLWPCYYGSHVARNPNWNDQTKTTDYYCLLKPGPSSTDGSLNVTFAINQLNYMTYSRGVIQWLRMANKATFSIPANSVIENE